MFHVPPVLLANLGKVQSQLARELGLLSLFRNLPALPCVYPTPVLSPSTDPPILATEAGG